MLILGQHLTPLHTLLLVIIACLSLCFMTTTTPACMAVIGLLYAILFLFRQRQAEFRKYENAS